MKLAPITFGRAVDLMREGKDVYFKSLNNAGRLRLKGERGCREFQQNVAAGSMGNWTPAELNPDHEFFEIGEPAKLDFQTRLTHAVPIDLGSVGLVFKHYHLEDFERFTIGAKVRVTIEEAE
jgi:hypothetical protein